MKMMNAYLTPFDRRRWAFGLIELMVVVAILAILLGLAFPLLTKLRGQAATTICAANLSQIAHALNSYAVEGKGFVPRFGTYAEPIGPNHPMWLVIVAPKLGAASNWTWSDLSGIRSLQCPRHPTPNIPSAYVQNNFAFESRPNWKGSPPVQIGRVRNAARVPWILEAKNLFGPSIYGPYDAIYFEPHHSVRTPDQVVTRVEFARHAGRRSNVLFFDGHVSTASPGGIGIDDFNDGIVGRFAGSQD
jgi:prepilin-type processing-associated H-X9-DG protein/prepilin-type N-terminal cleavage/methylation domain-containing protein